MIQNDWIIHKHTLAKETATCPSATSEEWAFSRNDAVKSRTGILPVPACKAVGNGKEWFAESNRPVIAWENFWTGWKRCPTGVATYTERCS